MHSHGKGVSEMVGYSLWSLRGGVHSCVDDVKMIRLPVKNINEPLVERMNRERGPGLRMDGTGKVIPKSVGKDDQ